MSLIILMLSIMEVSSQGITKERQQFAAGRFYSSDKTRLTKELDSLFLECEKIDTPGLARAIIVPHAGYIYSGEIAASAFSTTPKRGIYKNIFIIGSTHVKSFSGASVYGSKDYVTPLGKPSTNEEIVSKLKEYDLFSFPEEFHENDHNIEVEIPFIQHYYEDSPQIVPIIIGTDDRNKIKKDGGNSKTMVHIPENLFVISSDFSHYPLYEDAIIVDSITAEAFMKGDPDFFIKAMKENSSKNIPGFGNYNVRLDIGTSVSGDDQGKF